MDLNVFKEDSIIQLQRILEARRKLNMVMGVGVDTLFEVADSISFNEISLINDWNEKLKSSNSTILQMQKQIEIAKLYLAECKKQRFPTLNFSSGYYYSLYDNSEGALLKKNALGPMLGVSVSIPIYQAGKVKREVANAKIEVSSSEIKWAETNREVYNNLRNTIEQFDNQQKLLDLEKLNLKLSKENYFISLERIKFGQTTSLEVHLAQENYVQAYTRLINFEYNLKIAEVRIKQLLNEL